MSAAKKAKKSKTNDNLVATNGKLMGKDYERELTRLHVELVKLQRHGMWCIPTTRSGHG